MIFISHAREDKDIAKELTARLSAAGFQVWSEEDQTYPGDNFASAVGKAMEEAKVFLVLVTPAASESEWVAKEVQYALTRSQHAKVIPVFLGDSEVGDLPWVLKKMSAVHVQGPGQLDLVVQAVQATLPVPAG